MRHQIILLSSDIPSLAPNRSRRPERVPGVVLVLDIQQPVVVGAEEGLLEVRLHDVALVQVGPSLGRDLAERPQRLVPELEVDGADLLLRRAVGPLVADDAEQGGIAPGRVDGAVGGALGLAALHVVLDQAGAGLDDGAERVQRRVERRGVLPVLGGEDARPRAQVGVGDALHGEVRRPRVVEVVVLEPLRLQREAERLELRQERRHLGLELVERQARHEPRQHRPGVAGDAVEAGEDVAIAVAAPLGEAVEPAPVGVHYGPEELVGHGGIVSAGDNKRHAGEGHLGVHLECQAGDDAKGSATAPTNSPEEIRVLLLVGSDEAATREDDVNAEDLVGAHPVLGHQGRMATAGHVTTSDTDSLALTADGGHSVLMSGSVNLADLNARANLERGAGVARRPAVILDELDLLQVVGPDRERARTGRLAEEVVAGIVDDKPQIEVAGKVDSQLDLRDVGDVDRVGWKAAELAVAGVAVLWHTGLPLE